MYVRMYMYVCILYFSTDLDQYLKYGMYGCMVAFMNVCMYVCMYVCTSTMCRIFSKSSLICTVCMHSNINIYFDFSNHCCVMSYSG